MYLAIEELNEVRLQLLAANYRENSEWQKCSYSGTSINKTHEKHALLQGNRHVWENTKQNNYKSRSGCTCFYLTERKTIPTSNQPKTSVSQLALSPHSWDWIKNSLSQNSFEPPVSFFLHLPQDTGHVFQHTPSPEFSGHILIVQDLSFLFFFFPHLKNLETQTIYLYWLLIYYSSTHDTCKCAPQMSFSDVNGCYVSRRKRLHVK